MRDEFRNLVLLTQECAKIQFADKQIGRESFYNYRNLIISKSKVYDHHLGNNGSFERLIDRFILETAILHVLTALRNFCVTKSDVPNPILEDDSFYSWFEFSCLTDIRSLANKINAADDPEIKIIDICHQIISDSVGRHIGEFYTPAPLVEHLIELAEFNPKSIQENQKIVDPACGGGMILVRVAQIYFEYCIDNGIKPEIFVSNVENAIYGFDIQPFAITLTRTILGWLAGRYSQQPIRATFRNIRLIDPLLEFSSFWENPLFDFVISNPPFMALKKDAIPYIASYAEIVYGHPNLYSLFIWWAIKSSKKVSKISLLVPQSMLAGAYFERLRKNIFAQAEVIAITRLLDRKGVVANADQQMMALALQKNKDDDQRNVSLRVSKNSSKLMEIKPIRIDCSKVIREIWHSNIWIVSNNHLDYEIEELVCNANPILANVSDFKVGNGGYVWNQNKEYLLDIFEPGAVPLISAASIANFQFSFPHRGTHASKSRSFSKLTPKLEADLKSGDMVLIQRTTPRKIGRRLVCCVLNEDFKQAYQRFFLENHINYIVSKSNDINALIGLSGWINSDLINFVFQLRNGSTQVSIFELGLLPVKTSLLNTLAEFVMRIEGDQVRNKSDAINSLNSKIYEDLGVTAKQKRRIQKVLSRKELPVLVRK